MKSAARIYTPPIFKLVKEQFLKSEGWEILEITQVDATEIRFAVSSNWGEHDVLLWEFIL